MSQTSIGRAALVLTTNGSGMRSGLDQEGRYAEKWAGDTGKRINARLKDTAKPTGGGGVGGMLGGLAAAGPVVAGVAVTVGAAVGVFKEAAESLQDLGRQGEVAGALGLTAEQFTGMAGVAKSVGEDSREFIESLVTMGKLGTDAAKGTEEASAAFQTLGLNANEFIKLRADEQFFQIFESLSKVQDPLQRTRALMAAFGEDGGKYLLPLLNKTPEQIRQMAGSFAVSNKQMESARGANQALASAGTALSQAWRAITIALAPVITLIGRGVAAAVALARPALEAYASYSNWLWGVASKVWNGIADVAGRVWGRIMARAQPVFDWLNSAWESVQEVAGWAWEGIVSIVVPVVDQVVSAVEQAIDAVADWTAELLTFTGGWPTAREVVIAAFRAIGTAAAYTWDVFRAGQGIMATVAGGIVEAIGSVVVAFKDTIADMVRMAKSLPKALAYTNPVLAGLRQLDDGAIESYGSKIQEAGRQLKEWGAAAVADFGGSAQQFNTWLDRMVARQKTATAEVKKEQAKVVAAATNQLAGPALIKGTSAEVSARLKYEFGGKGGTPEKQLAEQQRANGLLGVIAGAAQAIVAKPAGVELLPM